MEYEILPDIFQLPEVCLWVIYTNRNKFRFYIAVTVQTITFYRRKVETKLTSLHFKGFHSQLYLIFDTSVELTFCIRIYCFKV